MNQWWSALTLVLFLSLDSVAAQKPEVVNIDNKISINVKDIALGRLLELWDQATGMRSRIPPELADQKVSVHFSGLLVSDAVPKLFENIPVDYVFIESRGIVVTGASSRELVAEPPPSYALEVNVTGVAPAPEPVQQPPTLPTQFPPMPPPMIPTPFGPIISTNNPVVQLPPVLGEAPTPPFFAPPPQLAPVPASAIPQWGPPPSLYPPFTP